MIASLHDTIRKYSVRIKPKTVKITTKKDKKGKEEEQKRRKSLCASIVVYNS